jgi:hypothetical protein
MPRSLLRTLLWAAEPARKLDPVLRAELLMSLLGLILLGAALMLLVMMGGRYVRRLARHRLQPTRPPQDDWYRKPLVPEEPSDDEPQ